MNDKTGWITDTTGDWIEAAPGSLVNGYGEG